MTSIIKNQIIKHLSKFVKNLSADKINLSTLRGEGDLTNLELDEKILTELLELPNWLSLQKAWCNRVSIRIPWTKLKSVPICLNLDEVVLAMETSTEVRKPSMSQKPPSYATGGKYGFSDKVIDGVTLRVNSVIINFKSPAFEASLQLSRILLESCSPTWQPAELRFSRLKDTDQGFILLFKELQWQTLRLEARSKTDLSLPPLRLITNLSRCRITIKKRLLDCAVMGCRLVLIMDELLWVLTDAQLTSAMLFVQSLAHLIEQDTLPNQRVKAARKLETLPEYRAQQQQQQQHRSGQSFTQKMPTALSRVFARYDVLETSYHFFSEKIDLHFCDDPGDGRSVHPDLKEGGALQVTLSQLQVDYYPYHWSGPEGNTRKHWVRYEEGPVSRWMQQGLDQFSKQLLHFDSPTHSKLTRSPASDGLAACPPRPSSATASNPLQESILNQLRQLMATCMILRLGDLLVYRVSTAKSRQTPKEFVLGDRSRYALPEGMPIIHIELSQYYYPGDLEFPLPQPKCFVLVNPLQVNFDALTLLWLHSFSKSLEKTLTAYPLVTQVPGTVSPQLDIRLEALLPRVVMELAGWDRPRSLQLQSSRIICTNQRSVDGGSRADLAACLERMQGQEQGNGHSYSSLCFSSSFPAKDHDLSPISEALLRHATYPAPVHQSAAQHSPWKRDLFWNKEASQVWFVHLDPFWADFYTSAAPKTRPLPFIGTVPVIAWIHPEKERLCGLLQVSSLISVQLDRSEYVFLLRLMENLKETTTFLALQETLFNRSQQQSVVLGAVLPQLDVSILFPPMAASVQQSVDVESPLADTESIYPDTSSMTDLACLSRSVQNMRVHNSHSEHLLSRESSEQQAGSGSTSGITSPVEPSTLIKSQSDSMIDVTAASAGGEVHVSAAASVAAISKVNGTAGSTPAATRFVTFASDRPQQPLHSGFTSVKRGFTSLISSVDAALKHSNVADDLSDTVSIRSEASSDSSENYVILHGENEQHDGLAIFRTGGVHGHGHASASAASAGVSELDEVAVEVRADTPTNSDHSSAPVTTASFMSGRGREVAVVTFHINDLELIHQAVGSDSSVRMQAAHLSCNECIAIPKEEFQSKFSSRSRGWREVPVGCRSNEKTVAPLRVRMEQKLNLDAEALTGSGASLKDAAAAATDAWVEVSVTNLNLPLLMSSVTGLAAFAEDELLGPMMPMYLSLRNVECTLNEDRPPVRVGGPPPAPTPPLHLRLSHVLVQRSPAGVFSVGVPKAEVVASASGRQLPDLGGCTSLDAHSRETTVLLSRIEALQRENEALRQRLADVAK